MCTVCNSPVAIAIAACGTYGVVASGRQIKCITHWVVLSSPTLGGFKNPPSMGCVVCETLPLGVFAIFCQVAKGH